MNKVNHANVINNCNNRKQLLKTVAEELDTEDYVLAIASLIAPQYEGFKHIIGSRRHVFIDEHTAIRLYITDDSARYTIISNI